MIDTRLLTFINLSKLKNYTRTAEVLHMTQPAVTQHIKFLENHYNIKLFYKQGREYHLTEEGDILLEYAYKVLSLSDKTERLLSGTNGIPRKYRLGATLTIGGYLIPRLLASYKTIYPLTELSLSVKNTESTLKDLKAEAIDLALIEGEFPRDKFNYKLLKKDELILVASPTNHLTSKKVVTIEDIKKEKMIAREIGSGTRDHVTQKLISLGIDLKDFNISMEVGNLNATITLVASNVGISIISKEAVREELLEKKLIHIPVEGFKLEREFNFVYSNAEYTKTFIEEFIKFCKSEVGV